MNKKWIGIISAIMGVMLAFLVFGGTAKADGEASHTDHEGWTAVTALPAAEAGIEKVYLTADITQTSSYTLAAGQNLVICLNGHNITGNMTTNLFEAVDGSSITICNCGAHDDTHGVVNGSSKVNNIVNIEKKTGAVVGVTVDNVTLQNAKAAVFCNDGSSPAATVTLNRAKLQGFTYIGMYMRGYRTVCEITGNTEIIGSSSATREFYLGGDTSTCHFRSGVIKNMVQGAVAIAGSAKFNMYDGASIVDCVNNSNNSGNGAAVRINNYANSIFTMYGGKIDNCSGKCGGAVYVTAGKFDMQGGEITNCTATGTAWNQGGGAVYLNTGTFSMSGGKIQDCETKGDRGGAVYSYISTVNISGTALIGGEGHANRINLNQTNGGYGAGVHAYATTFTMTGGEISGHRVVYGGANLSLFENNDKGSTATITGGRIADGYLTGSNGTHMGANICVYGRSTLAIGSNSEANKPVITGGTNTVSGGLGGNIGLRQTSSLTISGYCEISGGSALKGGNIYMESGGTMTITGHPDIKNGTAPVGSNININGTSSTAAFTNTSIGDGEIALTNGSLTMENCRAGDLLLVKGVVHLTGNRFNSVSAGDPTMTGILTDGYYKTAPAPEMIKGSGSITPGTYVFGGETYNYKIESTYVLAPPSNVTYTLNDETDGFAGGLLAITLPTYDENITFDFEMYWGDENGKLPGYTRLPLLQATGETTYYVMHSESLIPVGATRLMVYTVERATGDKTDDAFVLTLPAGSASTEPAAPYKEFQVMSDVHIDERDSFAIHREHFNGMLNDIAANSPDSIGMFIVGDIANCGYESEYQLAYSMHDAVAGVPPMFWSIGNHEMKIYDTNVTIEEVNDLFVRYARLPDGTHPEDTSYDFWLEGYHFIFLGTDVYNQLTAIFEDETYEWLENALQENRDVSRPTFLFLHQSIFNTVAGCMEGQWEQGTDRETGVRLANVLKKYPEVVFFNGHSHYEMTLPNDHYKPTAELPINIFNTAAVAYISTDYGDYGNSHREVGSQGFYVRVYEDRIRVYAKDFVTGEWIPSAMYELNLTDRTPHADPEVPNTATGHVHCVCGAEHQSFTGGHGSEFPTKFTEVNSSTGLPIPGRDHVDYVYLTSDITLSSTYVLASG
ncbi:MAG: metallophosphoesterase, partial [Lachnospiraceae bacterium]|nr:metallophosphoesterase [Lachnospiraceae bacterium]